MNIITKAGIAVGSVSTVLVLAACGPSNSASGSSSPATASPASSTAQASAATSAAAPPASASPVPSASTAQAASGPRGACEAQQLKLSPGVGGGPGTDADGRAEATFNLYSSTPCSMTGFPGVDLIGTVKSTGDQTRFSLSRSGSLDNPTVHVSGESTAGFGILYAASVKSSTEFDATKMIMTPPDTYTPMTYTFSSPLKIELLNGSPNAEVGPVGSGGHP